MKTAAAQLIVMLATSKQFYMTETYTFTLSDGSVLIYHNGETTTGYRTTGNEPQAPIIVS